MWLTHLHPLNCLTQTVWQLQFMLKLLQLFRNYRLEGHAVDALPSLSVSSVLAGWDAERSWQVLLPLLRTWLHPRCAPSRDRPRSPSGGGTGGAGRAQWEDHLSALRAREARSAGSSNFSDTALLYTATLEPKLAGLGWAGGGIPEYTGLCLTKWSLGVCQNKSFLFAVFLILSACFVIFTCQFHKRENKIKPADGQWKQLNPKIKIKICCEPHWGEQDSWEQGRLRFQSHPHPLRVVWSQASC